ncbi:MAG TPA: hypothetical protein VJR06_04890, partial [Nitrososphaerales archaeon]|nr:hypothetical protein [Nitrososphaerales archaeon]
MDSRLATAALVALLVVATAVLGLTFGGGSTFQNPAGGGSGQASQSKTVTGTFPRIVVRAEAYGFTTSLELVNPEGPNTTSVTGIAVLPTPFPMAGVRFVLTELTGPGVPPSDSGALHSYSLTTNSSGVGVTYVLPGNYTVTASGSSFNFTTTVGMLVSTTTHLNVSVSPALEAVGSVVVANQDRVLGVEPTAAIYANVVGRLNYTLGTPYYLVGTLP